MRAGTVQSMIRIGSLLISLLHRNEYITIISIMVCMTVWDFVIGVLFGIIMSCVFLRVLGLRRQVTYSFFA